MSSAVRRAGDWCRFSHGQAAAAADDGAAAVVSGVTVAAATMAATAIRISFGTEESTSGSTARYAGLISVMHMGAPLLVVLAGRPGTGKTTLARRISTALGAVYLRVDAIETAVVRFGLARPPVGPIGYGVAHELAAANLALGHPVVVDAVNPVPEARAGWPQLAGAALVVLETVVPDEGEHRRRVEQRRPDLADQRVPTWAEVANGDYEAWDESRDGARCVIDMTDPDAGFARALACVRSVGRSASRTVGVCGPGGQVPDDVIELAYEVGARLAAARHVVATGGLDGVMAAAAAGAREAGGIVVGLLPGDRASDGNQHLSVALPTGLGQMRNAVLVNSVDAVIAVGASTGTLSEVAWALRSRTPVIWLRGWQITDESGARLPVPVATSAAHAVAFVENAVTVAP